MFWVFWLALTFLAYTFIGYPVLLTVISHFRGRPHQRAAIWPKVSVIIVAHNEARAISQKINNTLELGYPDDKWEIIVVSDGSDDGTADIVRSVSSPRVKRVEVQERRGKHYGQMMARDASSGEILVFTDVSVQLKRDALQKMVSNFADPTLGCVSSEDGVLVKGTAWGGERTYVDFETKLRRLESRVSSLIGVSGSFFAARRRVCEVWHPDQSSDFFVPLHAAARGLRTVVDPESVGYYGLVRSEKDELPRKVRTIAHGLEVFFSHLELLNPFRYGFLSWQLLSHKLFRWFVPYALLCLAISNLFLWGSGIFFRMSMVAQGLFHGIGLLGQISSRQRHWKPIRIAFFFSMANWATLVAWFKYFSGQTYVTWRPSQRF